METPVVSGQGVPPSIVDSPKMANDNNARGLAAFIIGVLSVGKFDKRVAQTIREKCAEFYP